MKPRRVVAIQNVFFARAHTDTGVLEDINLEVFEGDRISLLGPNGCGKTTLLQLILGRLRPTVGTISSTQMATGYVDQDLLLFPWMSIRKNILFALKWKGLTGREQAALLNEVRAWLFIDDILDKYPGRLSGGMRQRAVLARTFVGHPDFLLLDEPFSALDTTIKSIVHKFLTGTKATVILVTHDPSEAVRLSRKIVLMGGGKGLPGRIVAQLEVDNNDFVSLSRTENTVTALMAHLCDEQMSMSEVLSIEAGNRPFDRMTAIAWDLKRTALQPEFGDLMCSNLARGVRYRYFLPSLTASDLESFLSIVATKSGMSVKSLAQSLEVLVIPGTEIHVTSHELIILEREGAAIDGWQFPIPGDFRYVFRLSGERIRLLARVLSQSGVKATGDSALA